MLQNYKCSNRPQSCQYHFLISWPMSDKIKVVDVFYAWYNQLLTNIFKCLFWYQEHLSLWSSPDALKNMLSMITQIGPFSCPSPCTLDINKHNWQCYLVKSMVIVCVTIMHTKTFVISNIRALTYNTWYRISLYNTYKLYKIRCWFYVI